MVEHIEKLLHDLPVLRGYLVGTVEHSMEIEEIEYHGLHCVGKHLMVEVVLGLREAQPDHLKVGGTALPHLRREPHNGIMEQRQVAADAIVGLRRRHFDKLLGDVNHAYAEVAALLQVLHKVASTRNDKAVASLHAMLVAVAGERARAAMTIGMAYIA